VRRKQTRVTETSTPIGSLLTASAESEIGTKFDESRLSNGKIDGPSVILAYQTDDKAFVCGKVCASQEVLTHEFLFMCRVHL